MKATTGIRVSWTSNPVTGETTVEYKKRGMSLRQILLEIYSSPALFQYLDIRVDGKKVDVSDALFIQPEFSVEVSIEPQATFVGALLVSLAVSAVVGYIAYRYMKSKFGDGAEQEELDVLRNQRNRDRRFEPVRMVLGKRRVVPDLAALPWTEIDTDSTGFGRTNYLNTLLSVGHAPLKIEDIQIGDTPVSELDGVEIQVYDGWDNTDPIDLFPSDVFEEDVDFDYRRAGTSEVRTTAPNTDQIVVTTHMPNGLYRQSSSGGTGGTQIGFRVEYKPAGANDSEYEEFFRWREVKSTTQPFFVVAKTAVDRGQYDVRVTLYDRNDSSERRINDFIWQDLKSIRYTDPVQTDATTLIALRIRADERFSGNLDRVNCIATSMVPDDWDFDWSDWRTPVGTETSGEQSGDLTRSYLSFYTSVMEKVRNHVTSWKESTDPAELARWVYQGPFLKQRVADDKIDLDGLQELSQYAQANDFFVNAEVDDERALAELVNKIFGVANAELIVKNGKFSVAIDTEKDGYSAIFNLNNSNSLTFGREYLEPIDGYRVEFDNEETNYEEDEIVVGFGDGRPTIGNFERIRLWGITNYDQAYRRARRKLAERQLRQEAFSFTSNVQGVDVTRGDLVLVQIPTIGLGQASGWIRNVNTNSLIVDEDVFITQDEDYAVLIIKPDNTIIIRDVSDASNRTLTLDDTSDIEAGDRFTYGIKDAEARECLVEEVKPNSDLSFEFTCVNYAPEIFDIDGEVIPDYEPSPSQPELGNDLPLPSIGSVRVYRSREQTENGLFKVNVDVNFNVDTSFNSGNFEVQLQYRQTGDGTWINAGTQDAADGSFRIEGIHDRTNYDIRIRSKNNGGTSDWFEDDSRFIESDPDEDPVLPKVSGLQLYEFEGNEFTGQDIKLVWRDVSNTRSYDLGGEPAGADDGDVDPFFKHYEIEVVDPETREVLRTAIRKDNEYVYDFERNEEDGGPRRDLIFRVVVRGKNNQTSEKAAKIRVDNPEPPLHEGFTILPRFSGAVIRWNDPFELGVRDFKKTRVWVSEESGFDPDDEEPVYDGPDTEAAIEGLSQETTYYLRYQTFDTFGAGPISGEITFTTFSASDQLGLGAWAEVDRGTRDQIEDWLDGEPDEFGEPFFQPRVVAGQIVSGVIQATELIESEGIIRAVDDINEPSFQVSLGPQVVDGTTYLLNAQQVGDDGVIFGIDEFGGAEFSGHVSASDIEGSTITASTFESQNFVEGESGFRVDEQGNIEANDGVFRGDLEINTSETGARIEITDRFIKVFDSSENVRVQIGDLSL